ncbi:MAG: (2Fe-2S)-binding protein [Bacteroidetes bacterium]|nr:MAG: (2Fe-2S)-binding protein [Bacteroidota bacterium]
MEDNIICNCMDVSEHEIVDAIKNKEAISVQDIMDITGAGTGCGSCVDDIDDILKRESAK